MILSFNNALKSQEDNFADDSLKIDTINEIEELLSKQSKKIYNLFNQILIIYQIKMQKIYSLKMFQQFKKMILLNLMGIIVKIKKMII